MRYRVRLIDAHDFRLRGWILATDMDGAAVRSVGAIGPGTRLNLTFGDGRAEAVVEKTEEDNT